MKRKLVCILFSMISSCLILAQETKPEDKQQVFENYQFVEGITIRNATEINTKSLEFSPVLYRNGLVYVTSRQKNGPVDDNIKERYFSLYYADLDGNGMPLDPQAFSIELNSQLHEGPISFNDKQNRIYFTRNNSEKGVSRADSKGIVVQKIYEADRGYYDWENVRPLSFNSDEYSCMHPSLSPNGNKLFFSSNMPGGYGGMDLYFVQKTGETWSKPINMGAEINTERNEVFPFIHESGVLFFSSDGHEGMGGLDIYMIDISDRQWGEVLNLGRPINSATDDLGLILAPGGYRGYFSSARPGGVGKDDIYVFDAPNGLQAEEEEEEEDVAMDLRIVDERTERTIANASVFIFEKREDGLFGNDDLYDLELMPADENKPGELVLKMIRKNSEDMGEPDFISDKIGLASVAFKPDKDYLVLVSKPGYLLEEVNLVAKDIDPTTVKEVRMVPNQCLNLNGSVASTEGGLRVPGANIKVINNCDGTSVKMRTNLAGEFTHCLPIGCDFTIVAQKVGYQTGSSNISTVKIRGSRSIAIEIPLEPTVASTQGQLNTGPLYTGAVIVLENIYYDFNKSSIRAGAARELEALSKLMNTYPSMEIELAAHTDSRGTDEYNLKLSLKRAESAKRFLIRRGIDHSRIKAFGYGEVNIRNHCRNGVDCTEDEHQYNRRTEVTITRFDEKPGVNYRQNRIEIEGRKK